MAVAAITEDYTGEVLDRVENFHGNQVLYLGWDHHTMFCAPVAFAVPPDMPFSKVLEELMPGAYSLHPEFADIDWDKVQWHLNGESFTPDRDATLAEQGIDHKSIIRFNTPGLDGIKGCGS
jgi:phenol hydroxylase P4 protein